MVLELSKPAVQSSQVKLIASEKPRGEPSSWFVIDLKEPVVCDGHFWTLEKGLGLRGRGYPVPFKRIRLLLVVPIENEGALDVGMMKDSESTGVPSCEAPK